MAASIQELRERRNALAHDLQNLIDRDKTPEWTSDHQAKYDKTMADIDTLDAEIKRHSAAMERIASAALDAGTVTPEARDAFTKDPGKHYDENKAMRQFLIGGMAALTPDQLQRLNARRTGDIANVMSLPQAGMSTGTPAEGGYTVAQEYYRELTKAMKAEGGIRSVSRIIQTGTGAKMNFPAADATSEEGEIVGENQAVTLGETTFGNKTLDAFKYSSKKIALPFELLQDSMFDLEGYIKELLAVRIGRITNKHFTVGTGSNQPQGIVPASAAGKVGAAGQTASVTYDDLIDLEHSVDPAYRGNAVYLMHDMTVKALRKIVDANKRPIFVPGYEVGSPGGEPDRLLGRPIHISQEMPTMAANAKSILFGDFSKYLIREVMDLTLFRMADSNFILNGQIGFVAFNRQGGGLIDVGGAIKHYQNSAS